MASPHICGLLAYFVSLQPSSDSAYAVAEITPKKLKAHMISIATKGALSDMPGSTPNCESTRTRLFDRLFVRLLISILVLAWNGGGKSNYSEIIKEGGYDMTSSKTSYLAEEAASLKAELKKIAAELEELVAKA